MFNRNLFLYLFIFEFFILLVIFSYIYLPVLFFNMIFDSMNFIIYILVLFTCETIIGLVILLLSFKLKNNLNQYQLSFIKY